MRRTRHQSVWATQLDDAVMHADRAVLFVAEGVGCFATSWWVRLSPSHYVSRVDGELRDPALDREIQSWGSRMVAGGRQRTIDQGPWWSAQRLVRRVMRAVVEHDVQCGMALHGEFR